ncbi:MAG: DNA topoisomerase VI [Deltaproteobacteria bacterium]|nr:DNA topoisomerase IV subunit A [Thermoplasmata archaeon]RLB80005.1 MAG: DNA topoisomerase VI [Deltaproteobacteria bacterium]
MSTLDDLRKIAEKIYSDLEKGKVPSITLASRTKSNIVFDDRYRVWKYGEQKTTRSAVSLPGAYMLLRTIYVMDFIRKMIEEGKTSTLRELYYISEGWGEAKFNAQDESDKLAEDLEIITGRMREDFKLRPEEDGARVIGDIVIEERTRKGEKRRIHCQDDVGDAGYSIPYNVEKDKLNFVEVNADKIIAVETGGMFDRLVENRFDEKSNSILVHLKGQPARSTRRFIKRMNEELNLPVIVFTDGDPWSYRIYASVAYGAIKTAHISEYLATPSAQFLGVTPSDILNYDLPSDDLNKEDVAALQSELSDPRFNDEFWLEEIKLQLEIKKKAEQQALAKYGLDYVTDVYLPEKMAEMGYEV